MWNFLCENKLEKKLIAVAVDGAPTMISDQNGVYGRLKQKIPGLIANHCCIHKLALAVKNLGIYKKPKNLSLLTETEKDELVMKMEVKKFNTNIHSLIAFFTTSSKRLKILEDHELEILDVHLRLRKPLDVRWLSHYQALSRIFEIFPAIMQSLQDIYETDDNEEAYDLLAKIERFQFLFLVCVMSDVLKIINRPEIYFQKNILSMSEFTKEINLCINQLDLLYEGDDKGYYLQKFLDEFKKEEKEYKGYLLIYTDGEEIDHLEDAKK
jgi:hypothetical protein